MDSDMRRRLAAESLSPGHYGVGACFLAEFVQTFFFLMIIVGTTSRGGGAGGLG